MVRPKNYLASSDITVTVKDPYDQNNMFVKHQAAEESTPDNSTIFAVNSDVYFLYKIGKMCAKSGHNLFQGL